MESNLLVQGFKEVGYGDIELIKGYLELKGYGESNHNLVNIFEWLDYYRVFEYHETGFMLLINLFKGQYNVYMPFCRSECLGKALPLVLDLKEKIAAPIHLNYYTEEIYAALKELRPDLNAAKDRDSFDYIYDLASFRTFKGKKYQKKRNHLNNFLKNYADRYQFEMIDDHNVEEVMNYVDDLPGFDESLLFEKRGIIKVLAYRDRLKAKGGLIRIDGKVEAFLIASVLNEEMIQENVEKVNHEIVGLSQILLKEFFSRNYLNCLYLNREDDMGLENLRHSKMSYEPLYLLEKYDISL